MAGRGVGELVSVRCHVDGHKRGEAPLGLAEFIDKVSVVSTHQLAALNFLN